MFGESGVSHTGKMYTYYKCAAAKKKKTCDKKVQTKEWLFRPYPLSRSKRFGNVPDIRSCHPVR